MGTLDSIKERLERAKQKLGSLEIEYKDKSRGQVYQARKDLIINELSNISTMLGNIGRGSIYKVTAKVINVSDIIPGIIEAKKWTKVSYFATTIEENDAMTLFLTDCAGKYEVRNAKVEKINSRKIISL